MFWECRSARRSEKFPCSVPWPAGWESSNPAKELLPFQVNAKSLNVDPVAFWLKLVKRYPKLQLSHTSDKLVAMAETAQHREIKVGRSQAEITCPTSGPLLKVATLSILPHQPYQQPYHNGSTKSPHNTLHHSVDKTLSLVKLPAGRCIILAIPYNS
jgi:hypothetical protein